MRISALGAACLLVLGLAGLSGALYYDQAHITEWTRFSPSANAMNGPAEVLTAQVFTLVGAIAAGFGALVAGGSALLAVIGPVVGRWALRLVSVVLLVLMLLVAAALTVGALTGDEPAAVIDTPVWLLSAELAALALAVVGAGVATTKLWSFTAESSSR
ncbi:hypothetical protein GCM10010399_61250 [Dactylosporangium fulvum]|uniref:Uncharacterized protein n=1 Tax=Dactylosporangium fulvum TaxID=53359 RepID=A0ABY5W1C6_9ACTN|nr:hypothetical protein [Dactylosporangium fulvum]UWP83337.1 hypothetical protein Dfulv_03260 [Dactylosporangium fulvum]